ncbi:MULTISPECIES: hypothetical protein [Pseudomonas]|uniref:hypothetical protein n=1 Tax=Pseudomonas TaxID=286 RepID=UPI0008D94DD9|nr:MULTISPECIES: hypothetical protein [Pseudomonas]NMY96567.1 hypothetical protein [Pseudomonas proteolytica]OHW37260.1 hypothetical protein BHC62_26825 [Pseudomonas sp. 06C 126]
MKHVLANVIGDPELVQYFFVEARQLRIQTLNVRKQLRTEAAQVFDVEVNERSCRSYGDDSVRSTDRCMSSMSLNGDGWLRQTQGLTALAKSYISRRIFPVSRYCVRVGIHPAQTGFS